LTAPCDDLLIGGTAATHLKKAHTQADPATPPPDSRFVPLVTAPPLLHTAGGPPPPPPSLLHLRTIVLRL
jgi:hypothetical protein